MLNELSEMEKNLITQAVKNSVIRSVASTSLAEIHHTETYNRNPQYAENTESKLIIECKELTGEIDDSSRNQSENSSEINCGRREVTSESNNFNMKREITPDTPNPGACGNLDSKSDDELSLTTILKFDMKDSIKIENYRTKLKSIMVSLKMSK